MEERHEREANGEYNGEVGGASFCAAAGEDGQQVNGSR
jgi:hypothetical protein